MDVVTHDLCRVGELMLRYRIWWSRGKELVLRGHSIRLVRFRTFGCHVIPLAMHGLLRTNSMDK